jgi:hypothetical protein
VLVPLKVAVTLTGLVVLSLLPEFLMVRTESTYCPGVSVLKSRMPPTGGDDRARTEPLADR